MLDNGSAYRCWSTSEEIESFREEARAAGRPTLFQSPWRDSAETPPDAPFVVRLKAPRGGRVEIDDAVQGKVSWPSDAMDDLVLLRSDGTPTYMLAVVVDDVDMGITHVIRGDDHLNNTARQSLIYAAMDWALPVFAHIPLIHGADGKKLSKRHGALGVEEYRNMGYPAAAMRNYLARLGWSHGDDEFFTTEEAVAWFGLDGIGKSPARFDFKKLAHLSGQHIAATPDAALLTQLRDYLAATGGPSLTETQGTALLAAMPALKDRAKTYPELIEKAHFIFAARPLEMDEKSAAALDSVSRGMLRELTPHLQNASWDRDGLEAVLTRFAETRELKFGKLAQPLRAALAGRAVSPSVYDMMLVLGREETLGRLQDAAA